MTFRNLHMHSVFDDGKDTCRDMLEACLQKGMPAAGISLLWARTSLPQPLSKPASRCW